MGNHLDTRSTRKKPIKEHDPAARRRRASFKQYLRDLEEELLEDDLRSEEQEDDTDLNEQG